MLRKIPILALAFAFAFASVILGELSWGQDGESAVTGTVIYRQRIALPPEAIVNVQLQDVSLQDAPAKLIDEVKIPTAGKQVPIAFRIPFAMGDIDPSHSYAVRATILVDGNMMFTSTTSYPVITRGAPKDISIMVQQIDATDHGQSTPTKTTATLEGTYWKFVELEGTPVVAEAGTTEASLTLNADGKKLAGSSGCNRLLGGYKLRQGSLRFKPTGLTMMACPDPLMKQEQTLVKALKSTRNYRITGETLELLDGQRVLARLHAQPSKVSTAPNPRHKSVGTADKTLS